VKTAIIAGLALLAFVACGNQTGDATQAAQADGKTTVAEMGGAVMEPVEGGKVTGNVLESHDASGFTYVLLDQGEVKEWYVLGPVGLKKGEQLELETRMIAENFESKTLKRTFDKVTFARVVSGGTPVPVRPAQEHATAMAAQMPPGHGGESSHGAMGMGSQKSDDIGPINVSKAEGRDGKTVAEIWASRAALGDRNVVVRGKVVKSLNGIMDKNWIHLRDGSGSADAGDHDITITTRETAKVGDIVLVSGTVRVNKDFGGGYEYPVIIEEAKIRKE
jgi:hypothetical protein